MTCALKKYTDSFEQLTGGVGRSSLTTFYRNNFIFNNSADTDLELVSRTIGIDRVIDEFIFKFTHDRELDWLCVSSPFFLLSNLANVVQIAGCTTYLPQSRNSLHSCREHQRRQALPRAHLVGSGHSFETAWPAARISAVPVSFA